MYLCWLQSFMRCSLCISNGHHCLSSDYLLTAYAAYDMLGQGRTTFIFKGNKQLLCQRFKLEFRTQNYSPTNLWNPNVMLSKLSSFKWLFKFCSFKFLFLCPKWNLRNTLRKILGSEMLDPFFNFWILYKAFCTDNFSVFSLFASFLFHITNALCACIDKTAQKTHSWYNHTCSYIQICVCCFTMIQKGGEILLNEAEKM